MAQSASRPLIYLISIEDVVQSPIIHSQVISLLHTIHQQHLGRPIKIVALYPVLNWLNHRGELAELRNELKSKGLELYVWPLIYLTRYFYVPSVLWPLYWIQAFVYAIFIHTNFRPVVLHCRSYPAAVVGRLLNRMRGVPFVFDTRALYPEEGATLEEGGKSLMLNLVSFAMWKRIERRLMADAAAIAHVTQPCIDILAPQYPQAAARFLVVPTTTQTYTLSELYHWREQTRQELGLTQEIVVAYVGSWFEPQPMHELFNRLMTAQPDTSWHFLLIVSSRALGKDNATREDLTAAVRQTLDLGQNCTALSLPHPLVSRYLASADIAAQPVGVCEKIAKDERYRLTARTRISIKFTEYLACGLPVLVSQWAGAACDIVKQNDLGIVYDQSSPSEFAAWIARWQMEREVFRQRALAYAGENFAIDVVANRYLRLYRRLLI